MKESRIANRYAKALFELALEMNLLEAIKTDAALIDQVCQQNRDFVLMLRSPVIRSDKKLAVIKAIFEKHLQKLSYNFLEIIVRNRREELVSDIAQQLISIYKAYKNILSAVLTTAVEIDSETKQKILALLHKHTDAEIELNQKIDEKLIGGFILNFEDKQYDTSILRKIKNLHQEFDVNLYVKGF